MKDTNPRDTLYTYPQTDIVDFEFNEAVARVFPDMIRRSVPGYGTLISLIGLLAQHHAQPHSHCYDLGCSLGAATLAMTRHIRQPGCRIIAVDNAVAMTQRCRDNVDAEGSAVPIDVICADIRDIDIHNASLVVINFTLQFIAPDDRRALLNKIHDGLLPGGALVVSEKIAFGDDSRQQLFSELHHAFKKANGYSELEIAQKRTALENVLIPDTLEHHHQRLRTAGFQHTHTWFQCVNFASLLAIK